MPSISDEQVRRARKVDVLAYLRTHEPQSLRKSKGGSNEYYLAEHDSLKISNGRFHWFSRGVGGYSALDFLVKVRGIGFVDAVRHLTDGANIVYKTERSPLPKPAKPFTLPPANINNDHVYAYLRGRGIDSGIIRRCIDNGALYENTQGNCMFVGYSGIEPKYAHERGTKDGCKKDVSGSNKAYSFVLPPYESGSRNLACFEGAVDCLSHASIHKKDGDNWDGYRLSLSGVSSIALISFLERNPQVESVRLCLNSDKTGREATGRIIRELLSGKRFPHLEIINNPPPDKYGKDYNDTLQAVIQLKKQKTTHRSIEADI